MPQVKSDPVRDCIALGECRPRHASKKDTKRWCRGREGVEHQWTWKSGGLKSSKDGELGYRAEWEQCTACDRERHSYWWWTDKGVYRCHCGALMNHHEPSAEDIARWGQNRAKRYAVRDVHCRQCRYRPSDHRVIPHDEHESPPRTRCQCEIDAAKSAKRQHYEAKYSGAMR